MRHYPPALTALLLGAMGCASVRVAQLSVAREVGLRLWPAVAFLGCGASGVRVRAYLRVQAPTAEERCAAEHWDWGDGSRSGREDGSCVSADLEPAEALVVIGEHIYRAPGTYTVTAVLAQGRHVLARETRTLELRDGCGR